MRRIIHNTTALAACLSLLAPQLAMAELSLPEQSARQPGQQPLILAQATTPDEATDPADPLLLPEGEPVEEVQDEAAADGGEATAEETEAAADGAEAEALQADDAAMTEETGAAEAPEAEMQDETSELEAALAAEEAANASAEAEAPAEAEVEAETGAEAEAAPAAEAAAAPEAAAQAEADSAVEDQVEAQTELPEEPVSSAAPQRKPQTPETAAAPEAMTETEAATEEPAAEIDAPVEEEAPAPGETEASAVPEAEAEALATPEAEAEVAAQAEAASGDSLRLAQGDLQQRRAGEMPRLAEVLADEMAGGLTLASLTCLSGGTMPCANGGRASTPRGVVVERNERGELRLAPVEAQMYRVNNKGELVIRAAEENSRETEASREAAQASEPVSAAALDAAEGAGEVTEQQVTEESARSSSEDFATNLRDALAGATGQSTQAQADSSDDNDSNDLTRALLLGLGAVAVGSMLNNNRQVALSTPDRVVVTRADGSQEVIKDEVALLRQPGSTVTTENFDDGSSRTIVTREDGSRVVTIRDADLRVLRRTLVSADGTTTQLIDDTTDVQPVDVRQLPAPAEVQTGTAPLDEDALRAALQREANVDRRFTLSQIRNIPEVRALVAPVNIDAITFETGSAAIRPDQAQQLQSLGRVLQDAITQNSREIFMIEGHTDTVGSDAYNLALSDRRAESVALALTEYFDVPPENLVTQGYGEQFPRIRAEGDIRENRRASVRRISDLLAQ
ncbi:OmpA family protein [Paracoccus sp. T5]|uniref:OmpA family protein n=1 Tax=Paracoccus sp. T5 TaxID=3402161 RepID=UPI003AE1DC79